MKIEDIVTEQEKLLQKKFLEIDEIEMLNTKKVLEAFQKYQVSESDFASTTGYGYNDIGRDKIECIFADVLGAEKALVRSQFISGSHALTVALFALLRPGDLLLSISGKPYDTLDEVIGIKENASSLASYNIHYEQIDLVNDDFDEELIVEFLRNHSVKVIEIQRSKGYSTRKSLSNDKLASIIQKIRRVSSDVIISLWMLALPWILALISLWDL